MRVELTDDEADMMANIHRAAVYGNGTVFRHYGLDVSVTVHALIEQGLVRYYEPWEPITLTAEGRSVLRARWETRQ